MSLCRRIKVYLFFIFPPATKVRQGNVFTPVCQSFYSQGGVHGGGHAWQGVVGDLAGGMRGRGCT